MLLPETVDCVQNNVTLETFHRGRFLMTRLSLVRILDLFDQELRVFIKRARLELRLFFRQAERKRRVYPMDEARVVWFIVLDILLHFRRHRFVDHFVDKCARLLRIDCLVAISVDDFTLIVHHVVEIERPFSD